MISSAETEANELREKRDETEREELAVAMGAGGTGKGVAGAARAAKAAERDLEKRQKSRATRTQRDALDRALVDLAGFYRDTLVAGSGATVPLTNPDRDREIRTAAARVVAGVHAAPPGGRARLPRGTGAEREAPDRGRGDDDRAAPWMTARSS